MADEGNMTQSSRLSSVDEGRIGNQKSLDIVFAGEGAFGRVGNIELVETQFANYARNDWGSDLAPERTDLAQPQLVPQEFRFIPAFELQTNKRIAYDPTFSQQNLVESAALELFGAQELDDAVDFF